MDCYTAKLMNLASNFLRKPLQNVLCCSAAKSCTALCNPWTPASQAPLSSTNSWSLLKFMSIESMMPSNHLILCPPSPLDFNLSQHQGLFQWVSCSHQMTNSGISASASVLPMSIYGWFPLRLTGLISLMSKGLSGAFSSTTVWRHQFFRTPPSL